MTATDKNPSLLLILILILSITFFLIPIVLLTFIYPEAITNTVSDHTPMFSSLMVGFIGMILARSNFSRDNFFQIVTPGSQGQILADKKMSSESKLIFGISFSIFLIGIIAAGITVSTMF
jgi:hypothetical protein